MSINTDLDLQFILHPVKKDLILSIGKQSILRSIKNLILTNHYEIPFHPEQGSNVRKLLFEPVSVLTATYIRKEIENTLINYEPRINVQSVDVSVEPDQNKYNVHIVYLMENQSNPVTVDFILNKLR